MSRASRRHARAVEVRPGLSHVENPSHLSWPPCRNKRTQTVLCAPVPSNGPPFTRWPPWLSVISEQEMYNGGAT